MKFIDQHENYQNYESEKYYTDEISRDLVNSLKGYIRGHIENAGNYRHIISIVAKYVPCDPGSNWNFPWLHDDLDDVIWALHKKGKFPKFMDCIGEITGAYFRDKIDEINEILEESSIGYVLIYDSYDGPLWEIREDVESRVEAVLEAIEMLPATYENTIQHLEQAKQQLVRADNSRARKDALRDCVSALESQLKYLSGKNNIKTAVAELVDRNIGSKKIIRESLSIWTYVHEDVPDIRHGHTENVSIDIAEALYYVEKTAVLIKYLNRVFSN